MNIARGSLCFGFALFSLGLVAAQPGPMPIISLEMKVMSSEGIALGHVIEFGEGERFTETRFAVVAVDDQIKGKPAKTYSLVVRNSKTDLRVWKARRTPLLVFQGGPNHYWHYLVDLEDPKLCFSRSDFTLVRDPKAVVRAVRDIVRHGPNNTTGHYAIINPPKNKVGDFWLANVTGPGYKADGLYVPADARVEAMAHRLLESRDWIEVWQGLNLLRQFESKPNAERIRRLVSSDLYTVTKTANDNLGIELRHYPIRQFAYDLLQGYGIQAKAPLFDEAIPLYDSMETLTWNPALSNWHFEGLTKFKKLKSLTFPPGTMADRDLEVVGTLRGITSLTLRGNPKVSDAGIAQLASLQNLLELDLTDTSVTDASIPTLAALEKLQTLQIDRTDITDAGYADFIRRRPDVRVVPEHKTSILFTYMNRLDVDSVKRALKNDPKSINQKDSLGWTPLHLASGWNKPDLARIFIDAGADLEAEDLEGKTPLLWTAARMQGDLQILRMLLAQGANPNQIDHEGETALHLAVGARNLDAIQPLLAVGVDPRVKNKKGQTAGDMPFYMTDPRHDLLNQRMDELAKPVHLIPQTKATCSQNAFVLETGDISNWKSENKGPLTGPLQWSKTPSGRNYLGPFGQQAVTLKLTGLPSHKNVEIDIDLFVIGSWDGNGSFGAGPDVLDISIPGAGTALHSTFLNNTEDGVGKTPLQSFPDPYPFGFHPAYTGASESRTLGFVQPFPRDAVYKLHFTFPHASPDLEIVFTGQTVPQGDVHALVDDETWGLGSLSVKTD